MVNQSVLWTIGLWMLWGKIVGWEPFLSTSCQTYLSILWKLWIKTLFLLEKVSTAFIDISVTGPKKFDGSKEGLLWHVFTVLGELRSGSQFYVPVLLARHQLHLRLLLVARFSVFSWFFLGNLLFGWFVVCNGLSTVKPMGWKTSRIRILLRLRFIPAPKSMVGFLYSSLFMYFRHLVCRSHSVFESSRKQVYLNVRWTL